MSLESNTPIGLGDQTCTVERSSNLCHPSQPKQAGVDQAVIVHKDQGNDVSPSLLLDIRQYAFKRKLFMREETASMLRIKAYCRLQVAWSEEGLTDKQIRTKADKLYKSCNDLYKQSVKSGVPPYANDDLIDETMGYATGLFQQRDHNTAHKKDQEKALKKLAQQLPVWPWVESINGFGAVGLGLIIGETGDLSDYPKKGHLFKRLGCAVINDERQRRVTNAELAIEHGYNPERRSLVWQITDSLLKKKNVYKELYDQRKALEFTKPEVQAATAPLMYAHKRAMRYAGKRLIYDLYKVWRG